MSKSEKDIRAERFADPYPPRIVKHAVDESEFNNTDNDKEKPVKED